MKTRLTPPIKGFAPVGFAWAVLFGILGLGMPSASSPEANKPVFMSYNQPPKNQDDLAWRSTVEGYSKQCGFQACQGSRVSDFSEDRHNLHIKYCKYCEESADVRKSSIPLEVWGAVAKTRLSWRLLAQECQIVRYCKGCKQTTVFKNSGKVRRNVNGKTIFQFEIFKCIRDHTWNRSVPLSPLGAERAPHSIAEPTLAVSPEPIPYEHWCGGLEIQLELVEGKWRLDKTLAKGLAQTTRAGIAALIRSGGVLVNGTQPEGSKLLRSGDVIKVFPTYTLRKPVVA